MKGAGNLPLLAPLFHSKINFKMSLSQKYTLFTEYLDSIYFEGYADQLAKENPESYKQQFEQFKTMYA